MVSAVPALLVGWCGVYACGGQSLDVTREKTALISAHNWQLSDASKDPFEDRPPVTTCLEQGYGVEGTYFEVDTELCDYATFFQPSLHRVEVGQDLEIVYWFLDLWAAKPTEGHIAIATEQQVLYEDHVVIPAPGDVRVIELSAPHDIAAGDLLFFHIHNHGYNNWSISSVDVWSTPQ